MYPNSKLYRSESFRFKTKNGYKTRLIVVKAGDDERKRLIEKAEKVAKENSWVCL